MFTRLCVSSPCRKLDLRLITIAATRSLTGVSHTVHPSNKGEGDGGAEKRRWMFSTLLKWHNAIIISLFVLFFLFVCFILFFFAILATLSQSTSQKMLVSSFFFIRLHFEFCVAHQCAASVPYAHSGWIRSFLWFLFYFILLYFQSCFTRSLLPAPPPFQADNHLVPHCLLSSSPFSCFILLFFLRSDDCSFSVSATSHPCAL